MMNQKPPKIAQSAKLTERGLTQSYNVLLHGIRQDGEQTPHETANQIMSEGLKLGKGFNSVLGNCVSLGNQNIDIKKIKRYGKHNNYNDLMVIIVPDVYIKGDQVFYLGGHAENLDTTGQQYDATCYLDDFCCQTKGKRIPPIFVHGYLNLSAGTYQANKNHYELVPSEQLEEYDKKLQIELKALL